MNFIFFKSLTICNEIQSNVEIRTEKTEKPIQEISYAFWEMKNICQQLSNLIEYSICLNCHVSDVLFLIEFKQRNPGLYKPICWVFHNNNHFGGKIADFRPK